jgi:AcrR family transcriptional regulator
MATNTKERILDAAEELFADRGFPSTSMRDITQGADANIAAVNYHFGSKEALLLAVLKRRIEPVNQARVARLDELESSAGDQPISTEDLVRTFLTPVFDTWRDNAGTAPKYMKLLGRIQAEVDQELRTKFIQQFGVVLERFAAAFEQALPNLDAGEVRWRVLFLIGSLAYTMTWGTALLEMGRREHRDAEHVFEALVQYATAGMNAPHPAAVVTTNRETR